MKTVKYFLFSVLIMSTLSLMSCSKNSDDEPASIVGSWKAVRYMDDSGEIIYGQGNSGSIVFTLNADGTYSWLTNNTDSSSSLPVVIKGTYAYTPSNNRLKIDGRATVGQFGWNDNHLYTVLELNSSMLIITEDTKIDGVGVSKSEFSRK